VANQSANFPSLGGGGIVESLISQFNPFKTSRRLHGNRISCCYSTEHTPVYCNKVSRHYAGVDFDIFTEESAQGDRQSHFISPFQTTITGVSSQRYEAFSRDGFNPLAADTLQVATAFVKYDATSWHSYFRRDLVEIPSCCCWLPEALYMNLSVCLSVYV